MHNIKLWVLAGFSVVFGVTTLVGDRALAGPNSANSSIIPTRMGNFYTGISQSCGVCHGINSGARPNDSDGTGTSYGRALDQALNIGSGSSESSYIPGQTDIAIDNAIRAIEASFAPYISNVSGNLFSSTNTSLREVTIPGTQTNLSVTTLAGRGFTGSTSSITAYNPSNANTLVVPTSTSSFLNIDLSTSRISLRTRGDRRRANQPLVFDFAPVNATGFRNTTTANQNRNRIRLTFANIAPSGVDDLNFIATNANTVSNPLELNVLANDSDLDSDGSEMTVQVVGDLDPRFGTITRNADGRGFSYVVPALLPLASELDADGTASFTYQPEDNDSATTSLSGRVTTVSIRIPVRAPENPPVLVDDSVSGAEDTPVAGDVSTNDSDLEGIDTLSYSIASAPAAAEGSVVMAADGMFTFTPAPDFNGVSSFTYSVFDGTFTRTANVDVAITPVNDAPVAQADNAVASSTNTNADPLVLDVLANDSDVDDTTLTVALTQDLASAADGTVTPNGSGTGFLYSVPDPLPATARTVSFQYRAIDDDAAQSDAVTVSINVPAAAPVGGPPIARNDLFNLTEDTMFSGNVTTNDVDPDGLNTVTFSVTQTPPVESGALTFETDGTFTFEPAENFFGAVDFRYTAFDGSDSDDARVRLDIAAVNDAPVALPDAGIAQADNGAANPLEIAVLANDSDVDSTALRVELVDDLAGGATDGTVTLSPDGTRFLFAVPDPLPPTSREVMFTYRAVDDLGLAGNTVAVAVRVPGIVAPDNTPPIANDDAFTFDEDTTLSGDVSLDNGSGADGDADAGDTLTYSISASPPAEAGTLTFNSDGTFSFDPAENLNGTVIFEYVAFDGTDTDTATVTLTIAPVNDPPIVSAIALADRSETEENFTQSLLDPAFVSDPDGDRLTLSAVRFTIVDPPELDVARTDFAARRGAVLTLSPQAYRERGNGALVGLDNDETATLTVTYEVSDGVAPPVSNSLTFTVIGVDNGLGRLAGAYADSISQIYNGHFGGTAQANGSCLTCHRPGQVDADVDRVDQCRQTPQVFNEFGLALCLDRSPDVGPLEDLNRRLRNAEARFAPRLDDVATIVVEETVAAGEAVGTPLSATPGLTVDGAVSSIVQYLIVNGDEPRATDSTGQFTVDDSGQMRVAAGQTLTPGVESFVVLPVNDAGQKDNAGNITPGLPGFFPTVDTLQTIVTVRVVAVLTQPENDTANTEQGLAVDIPVIANDDGGRPTALTIDTAPSNGTAVVNSDFSVTYTPDATFVGTETFTYTTSNSRGTSTPATVTVEVLTTGSILARDDVSATLTGTDVTIPVLANDINAVTEGAQATVVTIETAPPAAEGTLAVVGQSLRFTPATGFSGTTTAQYRARNPGVAGAGTVATLSISVIESGSTAISDAIADPQLRRVAQAFEQTCTSGGATAEFLSHCANITAAAVGGEDVTSVFQAIRNEEHFAAVDAASSIARGIGRGLQSRIRRIREGGARGFDVSGISLSFADETLPGELLNDLALGFAGLRSEEAETDWGFFLSGEISLAEKDASGANAGFDLEVRNVLIGADKTISPGRAYGFALGYSESETEFNDGGTLDANGAQAAFYGLAKDALAPGINLEGYLAIGRLRFQSDRRIRFTANGVAVDAAAAAQFDGNYVNIAPTLSFSQSLGRYGDPLNAPRAGAEVTWSLGLDYLRLNLDGYSETGGAGLALATQASSYESLQLVFGSEVTRPIYLNPRHASEIYGGLRLRAEILDDGRSVSSSFLSGGAGATTFTTSDTGTEGFAATLNLGTRLALNVGEIRLDYAFDFNDADLTQHSLSIGYSRDFARNNGQFRIGLNGNRARRQDAAVQVQMDYSLKF